MPVSAAEVERVAAKLCWGPLNVPRSKHNELRFGTNGSKSVDLRKGVWFDHEVDDGGSLRDLFESTGEMWPANGFHEDIVAIYDYRGEHGRLLFQVVRKPGKKFVQRRPDPATPGRWLWNLGNVGRVLYRLPELNAADPALPVLIPEGEKDADRLRSLGLIATCNPGGAGKWRAAYSEALRGRDVVLLPDNDEAGRKHAETVGQSLAGIARSVRIVSLPDLAEKADVSDWLDGGGTIDQLAALIAATPKAAPGNGEAGHQAAAEITDADFDAEIARLAALAVRRYERQRIASAKLLEIPVTRLDRIVALERGDGANIKGQGRPLDLPPPEPWSDPVDGTALLDALAAYFGKHLAVPAHAKDALALWTVHCHAFDAFDFTPRLQFKSPTKGAGKSTAMLLLKLVTPKAIEVETVSVAFLFRAIELVRPTVLLDEADRYLAEDDELIATVNAGVRPGATAGRCVGEDQEPRVFCCHAPIALASIGTLPGTIEDRCIRIMMRRRTRAETIEPIDEAACELAETLQRQAARWTADHAAELRQARPGMGILINRAADRWRALYAVAELAGGEWPERTRKAMEGIAAETDDDAESLGERLLANIRAVLGELEEAVASADLVERLIGLDGRPWAEMGRGGKALTQNRLARLLKPFKIWPRSVRIGTDTPKGYPREAFSSAFERYLDA